MPANPLNRFIDFLTQHIHGLYGIYLYGSRANDRQKKDSDWDIAFLGSHSISAEELWEIKTEMEARFNTDIDLIDLTVASTVLKAEVLRTGKLVYHTDQNKIAGFEYLTLSYYQKLNEERAGILRDIKESGSIYG